MSPLFGKSKKGAEETVLVVDVESGSVAAALVVLSPGEIPKLFAESRVVLPIQKILDVSVLAGSVERGVREALRAPSLLAARLRNAAGQDLKLRQKLSRMGAVSRAVLFFGPPWAALQEQRGSLVWSREPALARTLRQEIEATFGPIPIAEYSFGQAASGTAQRLFERPDEVLLCTITGEVAELLLMSGGAPHSYATIPAGSHTLLRTLGSHAGVSAHEARSALALARRGDVGHLHEPLAAAALEFSGQFGAAAAAMQTTQPVREILVFGPEPIGEWFARALTRLPLTAPFDANSAVRALHTRHLGSHVTVHTPRPDLILMVEAVSIGSISPGVY
jgi:hypothetical protein